VMNQSNPLISIIMATYNRERTIGAALESILQQNYQPLEIIVIDDGSTDGTPAAIHTLIAERNAPIHYVQQQNRGLPAAHNHGLRLARGEVIAFIDSDDLWPAGRLPAQLTLFTQAEHATTAAPGIVLGRQRRFVDGVTVDPMELAMADQRAVHYSLGTSLFARWVFDIVGNFDETMRQVADWDWFARAREAGIAMIADPRVTLLVRVHDGNLTQDRAMGGHFTVEMIKKHLDREREAHALRGSDPT
jgi:glycosyltransferase involved in cell wall biosynthesis